MKCYRATLINTDVPPKNGRRARGRYFYRIVYAENDVAVVFKARLMISKKSQRAFKIKHITRWHKDKDKRDPVLVFQA
jgi:hypothetical protein